MQTYDLRHSIRCALALAILPLGFATATHAQGDGTSQEGSDEGVVVLSPFTVNSATDKGYGATTAYTATRIGIEILKTPLNVQVVTAELIEDQGAYNFLNALRYTSGMSGDSSSIEAGSLFLQSDRSTIRGFVPNVFLRNGFRRSANLTTENADRIEVVKGPASVFFGQSAPGGVVNIISRRPRDKFGADIDVVYGSYDYKKAKVDVTGPIAHTGLAYRVYASRTDADDWRDYTYTKQDAFNPSIGGKIFDALSFNLEFEHVRTKRNVAPYTAIGNQTYLDNYASPPEAFQTALGLTATQLQARWLTNINQWIKDTEQVTGITPFRITDYIPEISSRGIRFNQGGADQYIERISDNVTFEANLRATDWLDLRYGVNYGDEINHDLRSALTLGNGDGTVNLNPVATRNRSRTWIHQFDALFHFKLAMVENKFVLGAQYTRTHSVNRNVALSTAASPEGAAFYRYYDAIAAPEIHLSHIPGGVSAPVAGADQINPTTGVSASWFGEWFGEKRLATLVGIRHERDVRKRNGLETLRRSADTPMYGLTYRLMEGISAFASYSENFAPNGFRTISGGGVVPEDNARDLPIELGKGWDIGLKADSKALRVSGSLTIFQVERSNIPRSDFNADVNDPRNANGLTQPGSVRYMVAGGLERTQGSELDLVWSPISNYQALISATWMWDAGVVKDPSIDPSSLDYERQFEMGRRLRNAPEYMFSLWNKYTFGSGPLKGFAVGAGLKYSSEVEPRAQDLTTYLINPAFTTVDLLVSYETKVRDRDVSLSVNVQNLFDEEYYEGNTATSDPLKVFFRVGVGF